MILKCKQIQDILISTYMTVDWDLMISCELHSQISDFKL